MRNPFKLLIADVHLHPFPEGNSATKTGYGKRVDLTMEALFEVYTKALTLGIDVIIAGDLLHSKKNVPVHVVRPLLSMFDQFKMVHTTILVGNHERPDYVSPVTSLDFLRKLENVTIIDKPYYDWDGGHVDFAWLPWTANWEKDVADLSQQLLENHGGRPRVLIGHGAVDGATTETGIRLSNPRLTQESLHLTSYNVSFWGDIHGHQPIADNAWYIGALCPQNYGERDIESGYVVLYDDLSWERMPIMGGPKFAYAEDVEEVPEAAPDTFVRLSPQAIGKQVMEEQSGAAETVDLTDLDALLRSYVAANPIPEGFTYEQVFDCVKGLLK